jgi:hypothetical protein
VTATDSTSPTPQTATVSGTSNVIALPAYNYDFPNPQPWRWEVGVRTGWIWQTPSRIYAVGGYSATSKFIAYAVIVPQPFNVRRHYENPLPIPDGRWQKLREWYSGPPLPLQTTPYHPFGAQVFPERLTRRPHFVQDFAHPANILPVYQEPQGARSYVDRYLTVPRQYMDHTYPLTFLVGVDDVIVSYIWG